ncbi:hypothetical protein K439DRAFT_1660087 [Ramaria rubella]|nr:hypothetical protein K439DRAFT_1660087 [Ramaria rubella]
MDKDAVTPPTDNWTQNSTTLSMLIPEQLICVRLTKTTPTIIMNRVWIFSSAKTSHLLVAESYMSANKQIEAIYMRKILVKTNEYICRGGTAINVSDPLFPFKLRVDIRQVEEDDESLRELERYTKIAPNPGMPRNKQPHPRFHDSWADFSFFLDLQPTSNHYVDTKEDKGSNAAAINSAGDGVNTARESEAEAETVLDERPITTPSSNLVPKRSASNDNASSSEPPAKRRRQEYVEPENDADGPQQVGEDEWKGTLKKRRENDLKALRLKALDRRVEIARENVRGLRLKAQIAARMKELEELEQEMSTLKNPA